MEPIDVIAPMPATVVEAMVAVGDTVTVDQEIIILESMKMEVPVTAPVAGTVSEILAADGASIAEGDVLIRIKADGASG